VGVETRRFLSVSVEGGFLSVSVETRRFLSVSVETRGFLSVSVERSRFLSIM
jgi:hypothetical protein